MKHTSYIELNKGALKKNIRFLKKRLGSNGKFVSVVKGNAYGHGTADFVPLAEECGIDYFAVSDADEAEEALKVKSDNSELMLMNYIESEDLAWAIENDVTFYVFDFDRLRAAAYSAKKLQIRARIHIELETGMNRTGFLYKDCEAVVDFIKSNKDLFQIEGICTHYAGAESVANYVRVMEQRELYKKMLEIFTHNGIVPKYRHTASSASTLTYEDTIMDMARIGIAQYGYWPSKETRMFNLLSPENQFKRDPLNRVISWKSKVMQVRDIEAGKFLGYGTSYMTGGTERIAIVPIGYSRGFSRSLSNLGTVLIRGRKLPVVGMVNMNMVMINASECSIVKPGDEVVIVGKQGKRSVSFASFADLSKYVNYEMLTRLPSSIPRFVV